MFNEDALLINSHPPGKLATVMADFIQQRTLQQLRNEFCFDSFPIVLYDGQGNRIDFYSKGTIVGSILNLAPPAGKVRNDIAARDIDPLPRS